MDIRGQIEEIQNISFITIKVDVGEHDLDMLQNQFPNLNSITKQIGKVQVFSVQEEPLLQIVDKGQENVYSLQIGRSQREIWRGFSPKYIGNESNCFFPGEE